jgi:hypothetical protein
VIPRESAKVKILNRSFTSQKTTRNRGRRGVLDRAGNSLKLPISEAVCDNHPREVQTVFDALPLNVGQFASGSIAKLRVLRTKPNFSPDWERASKYGYMYFEV